MKDDRELVATSLAGGPEAFGPIIDKYRDAVFGVALARLGSCHDAEDVAQSVFVQAFERLGGLREPARLGAWLRTIAIRRSLDHLRRQRPVEDLEQVSDDMVPDHTANEPEQNESRQRVLDAINRLSKVQRETVTLFYINGYTQAQVAGMQEVPLGTVKARLHYARAKLKKDMMHMVEDVLKSEAPKEDFGQRVFELLCLYPNGGVMDRWREARVKLRELGGEGSDGFVQALESPHSPTRRFALHMLQPKTGPQEGEAIVKILIKALADPNRKVRRQAITALLYGPFEKERVRRAFVPAIVALLADPSKRVRRSATAELVGWAADVPIEAVVKALLAENDPESLKRQKRLLHAIVYNGEKKY